MYMISDDAKYISDLCASLMYTFNLKKNAPNGIKLELDGFALLPGQSVDIIKEDEIIKYV